MTEPLTYFVSAAQSDRVTKFLPQMGLCGIPSSHPERVTSMPPSCCWECRCDNWNSSSILMYEDDRAVLEMMEQRAGRSPCH